MGKKSTAKTKKQANAKADRDKGGNKWRVVIKETGQAIGSSGWLQIGVAMVLILVGPAFGVIMQTHKSIVIGTALGLTIFIWLVALVVVSKLKTSPVPESELHGFLEPANDPDPPLPPRCVKKYRDSWGVFYGSSVNFSTQPDVTIVTLANQSLLSVRRTPNGLAINASIYSEDGRIVAEVRDNEFTINQNNYFRRERRNKSTLVVYDQFNAPVFSVRYVNPSAIKVTGVFRHAGRTVTIDDVSARLGNFTLVQFCTTNSGSIING